MTGTTLRIASYNIRKARGLDGRRDPGRVLDVINALEADIVVLQEADRRLGARKPALPHEMIEDCSDFRAAPVARSEVSLGWHGNAVLLRKGLELRATSHIALPGLEPRGALVLRLGGDVEAALVATHLGLRRRDRLAQQRAILEALPEDPPILLAGDLNEWSDRRGLEPLAARFDIHAPGRSFHARRPVAALDRFGLGQGVSLRDAGVSESKLARRASDHLPIWADVEL